MNTTRNRWQPIRTTRYGLMLLAIVVGLLASRPVVGAQSDQTPGSPQALLATAGDGTVTLAWTAPGDAGASPVTGYDYQYGTEDQFGAWAATDHNVATHHTVAGLTNETQYTFRVRARSAEGPGEEWAEASATPNADFRPVITADSTDSIGTTFMVTISFNRDVPEFPRHAVVVHGGQTVAHGERWGPRMSRPNGREWVAHIGLDVGFPGALTIDVPAGAVRDADGNPSLAAVQYTRSIKAEHVRPRLYMDLAPVEGTPWYRDPLEPVSGPFTVRLNFVTQQVLDQPVTGLTADEVKITNGTKSNFRQLPYGGGDGHLGDYEVTVTPDAGYTGPFTVVVEAGAAYGCEEGDDPTTCDAGNLSLGDTLPLQVVAP